MLSFNRRKRRYHDIGNELPPRVRKEPRPGDNPLRRPYPPHRRDTIISDRLLEDVSKTLHTEFVNRDSRTAARPSGVLFFHVLDIQRVKLSKKNFIPGASFCIYLEYECQGVIKCSYPVTSFSKSKIRIDHYVHFSAEVCAHRSEEANDFVIHVYGFQDPEKHWLIGSQVLHMFNFVRDIHGITDVDIHDDLSYNVGCVTFEYAWSYGSFGYGYSNQLLNTKIPAYESVCHSMFPRVALTKEDLIDNKFRVRVPRRLRLVNLHSILVRLPVSDTSTKGSKSKKPGSDQDFNKEAKTLVFRRVKFSRGRPVHAYLNLDIHQKFLENDFNHAYGEYICLRNRRERLFHLTRMLDGRLKDRFEVDANEMFYPIQNADDCRERLAYRKPDACPPGAVSHKLKPKSCPPGKPTKLSETDQQFIDMFPSAPRFSGYLAHVFGYAESKEKKPVENCEFKVDQYAFLGGGHSITDGMTVLESIGYRIRRYWFKFLLGMRNAWEFIFGSANASYAATLPEISVTLPSPADSATEFYTHCVQEKLYPKIPELDEVKRITIQLVRTGRRKYIDDPDSSEDWETEEEAPEKVTKKGTKKGSQIE